MTTRSMTVTETKDVTSRKICTKKGSNNDVHSKKRAFTRGPPRKRSKSRTRIKLIIGLIIILIVLAALCGYFVGVTSKSKLRKEPPDPLEEFSPSASKLHTFQKAAVCTDAPECAIVGRDILNAGGSAVDSAIAAMFCNGLRNQQSMGVGGGFFMTVYIKSEEKAYSVIARETAPKAASRDMYHGDHSKSFRGPLAVGIPGEVRGMWKAHKRWGILPWADLIKPTLDICRDGLIMSKILYDGLQSAQYIVNDSNLRKVYYDDQKKEFHRPGTKIKASGVLCHTLQRISDHGGDDFYNGSLAEDIVNDLAKVGSIITIDDLAEYEAKITAPLNISLPKGDTLFSPPPPSSGLILATILNILKGYEFNRSSINSVNNTILTYHRVIEAFKYAYGTRTKLGDEDYLDLHLLIKNVTSTDYGNSIRDRINDTTTSNSTANYGAQQYTKDDAGTAHISIIAPNGDAVAVTSSINYYFGAGFTTLSTGIIMNNVMDDFSSPGITNLFGLEPSPANFIVPGKRPLSSMTPSIIIDENGNAKMVIGASGGTKITTAIALTVIRKLWFDQTIKEAVDSPRFHHQIFPMSVMYEFGIIAPVISGLKAKGHEVSRYRDRGSVVCALYRNRTGIYANADFRKGGNVVGVN